MHLYNIHNTVLKICKNYCCCYTFIIIIMSYYFFLKNVYGRALHTHTHARICRYTYIWRYEDLDPNVPRKKWCGVVVVRGVKWMDELWVGTYVGVYKKKKSKGFRIICFILR